MESHETKRAALVTGGAQRLGRAIALALAEHGWDVAVHYRTSSSEAAATVAAIENIGRKAIAIQCDLSDAEAVSNLLARAEQTLGCRVSCVINNASLFAYDDAESFTATALDEHMHVNVAAPILLATSLAATTPADSQSVVVNLLDQKLYNLNPDFLSYSLSKIALDGATTMLAQALAPKVRVVGVAPGLTLISHMQSPDQFATAHKMAPLGQSSTPNDVAQAVVFAAANRAITGTTIVVDGGQHLVPTMRDFSFQDRT